MALVEERRALEQQRALKQLAPAEASPQQSQQQAQQQPPQHSQQQAPQEPSFVASALKVAETKPAADPLKKKAGAASDISKAAASSNSASAAASTAAASSEAARDAAVSSTAAKSSSSVTVDLAILPKAAYPPPELMDKESFKTMKSFHIRVNGYSVCVSFAKKSYYIFGGNIDKRSVTWTMHGGPVKAFDELMKRLEGS